MAAPLSLAAVGQLPTAGRAADARLRPQRGRLRGAGRSAVRLGLGAGRHRRAAGRDRRQHLRVRRAGQEGLDRHRARGVRRRGREGRRRRLPGRALRQGAGRQPARGRRRARLRRLPRARRAARRRARRPRPGRAHARRPAHPAAAHAGRPASAADVHVPGHAWIPRTRLSDGPIANLKLASGCDRRCTFCAIPSFRGAFVSRTPDEVVAEAAWLGMQGVRELVLVSENSTSYGKDLPGGTRALVRLLPRLTARAGHRPRARVLPAARRDAPGPHRGHRDHARRRAVLRPVVPARQPHAAAPDAPLRLAGRTSSTCAPASARSRRRRASAAT